MDHESIVTVDKDAVPGLLGDYITSLVHSGVNRRNARREANSLEKRFFSGTPDEQQVVFVTLRGAVDGLNGIPDPIRRKT